MIPSFGDATAAKVCPECGDPLTAEAFTEATIFACPCGYREAWHRAACDDNPQVWREGGSR